jgi:hypothetical protein
MKCSIMKERTILAPGKDTSGESFGFSELRTTTENVKIRLQEPLGGSGYVKTFGLHFEKDAEC